MKAVLFNKNEQGTSKQLKSLPSHQKRPNMPLFFLRRQSPQGKVAVVGLDRSVGVGRFAEKSPYW